MNHPVKLQNYYYPDVGRLIDFIKQKTYFGFQQYLKTVIL